MTDFTIPSMCLHRLLVLDTADITALVYDIGPETEVQNSIKKNIYLTHPASRELHTKKGNKGIK